MTDSKTLYATLARARNGLDKGLYPKLAIAVADHWQAENNHLLVEAVKDGQTTFAAAFEPLAKANLNIDLVKGTDDAFASIAWSVMQRLNGVLPLTGFPSSGSGRVNLTCSMQSRREHARISLKTSAIMGAAFGLFAFALAIALQSNGGAEHIQYPLCAAVAAGASILVLVAFFVPNRRELVGELRARHVYVEDVRRMARELDGIVGPSPVRTSAVAT